MSQLLIKRKFGGLSVHACMSVACLPAVAVLLELAERLGDEALAAVFSEVEGLKAWLMAAPENASPEVSVEGLLSRSRLCVNLLSVALWLCRGAQGSLLACNCQLICGPVGLDVTLRASDQRDCLV